jgi:stage II sporulation protein AA (anti-sigma F factor antagonist)
VKLSIIGEDGDVVRVRCEGELANAYFQGSEPLEDLLGAERMKRKVLLSLEKVRFLDSSGISWLLVRHKHLRENGGKLVLYDVPPLVRQPLEFTQITRVLPIASDEAAARKLATGEQ